MVRARRVLSLTLLAVITVPPGVVAQDPPRLEWWAASEDGERFVAPFDPTLSVPTVELVKPRDLPAALKGLPGTAERYAVSDAPADGGYTVAGLYDLADRPWVGRGETPVMVRAIAHGRRSDWMTDQQVIAFPQGCSDGASEMGACVHPDLVTALVAGGVHDEAAGEASRFIAPLPPGWFALLSAAEQEGTMLEFAGDSTVRTTIKVVPGGTIVVRGLGDIGTGYGGTWRAFDALAVDPFGGTSASAPQAAGVAALFAAERAELPKHKVKKGKPSKVELDCPPGGQGYVVTSYLVNGYANRATFYLGDDVEGGANVVINEIIPVDCEPRGGTSMLQPEPGPGPSAGLFCMGMAADHDGFSSLQGGVEVTDPSSIVPRIGVALFGVPPTDDPRLSGLIGGANGGESFTIELQPLTVDGLPDGFRLLAGTGELGVTSYGPKPLQTLAVSGDFGSIDLLPQAQQILGEAFEVTASEELVGNCPPGPPSRFTDLIIGDGFPSGSVPAWSTLQRE